MKRKIVLTLMPFLMTGTFILGCGLRKEMPVEETMQEEIVEEKTENVPEKQTNSTKIYYLTTDASQILSEEKSYENFDENFVINSLKEASVVPENVNVNSVTLSTKDDVRTVTVDFDKPFIDYLNTLSNPAEFGTTTSIANTYLDFFGADRFVFRVNNKEMRTNNKVYNAYYSKYEGTDNPEYGKFTTEVVENVTNEKTKAASLFETVKSDNENVIISPVMLKLSMFNMYDGVSEENKKEIASFIEDVDNTENTIKEFAKAQKDNFNSSIMYYESETNEIAFEDAYLNALSGYNTAIKGIDYTKSDATQDVNSYLSNLSFDGKTEFFDKIDKNSSIYDFTSFNFDKKLSQNFEAVQKDVFFNADGTESTVNYLVGAQTVPFFETDEIKGFVENYEESGQSIIFIQPKRVNINYNNIDLANILDYYSLEEKNVYVKVPQFNIDSTLLLNDTLKASNINEILTFGEANFEKMFKENTQYFLSGLMQYNKLSFDGNAQKLEEELETTEEIDLNKPFVFMVYDSNLDEVIYMGQINNLENAE